MGQEEMNGKIKKLKIQLNTDLQLLIQYKKFYEKTTGTPHLGLDSVISDHFSLNKEVNSEEIEHDGITVSLEECGSCDCPSPAICSNDDGGRWIKCYCGLMSDHFINKDNPVEALKKAVKSWNDGEYEY